MKKENENIKCPHCGNPIDVNQILYNQLKDEVGEEFNIKLISQKKKLEEEIRTQVLEEKSAEIISYQEQLKKKSEETKDLNKTKAELERITREKDELQEKIELESEQKLTFKINEEKIKIRKEVEEKNHLKVSEKEHIIEQLNEQLKVALRKAEQSSTQIQGEVQELAIEEFLISNFPLDTIEEIKKGARGADCFQVVNSRTKQNCGTIYYESKRTKDFQPSWVEKFKNDMREKGATFGVLVTDAFPKDMERLGQKDGVWVCSFSEFQGLCFVLREAVILLDNSVTSQENKGGKMEMLYEYLIGNEFRMQIEAIVEGFSQMHTDLAKEKRAMDTIWKQREKQIQKVLLNTSHMYGSIKGIAGNVIRDINVLDLSPLEEEK